jgi:hypothetical protein
MPAIMPNDMSAPHHQRPGLGRITAMLPPGITLVALSSVDVTKTLASLDA